MDIKDAFPFAAESAPLIMLTAAMAPGFTNGFISFFPFDSVAAIELKSEARRVSSILSVRLSLLIRQ